MEQNTQTRRNFFFNILLLLSNVTVGLIYTPYLVKELGIIAYGIIPLALIVNQYINVLTGSLTSSLSRFYSINLQRKRFKRASQYLSTSILTIVLFFIILSPVLYYFIGNIDCVFNIPDKFIQDAKYLFCFTFLSLFLSLLSSVLNITQYAYNRLDNINILSIIRSLGKLILVLVFFYYLEANIVYVGLAYLLTESIILCFSVYFFFNSAKERVYIRMSLFNKYLLVSIMTMSFWIILHQIGDTGLYRIDNFAVNRYWGTHLSGILGALSEFGNYTILIVSVISSLFGPLILIAYSHNKHDEVQKLTIQQSSLSGIIAALGIGTLIGFSKFFIYLWLGDEFLSYQYWLIVKLVPIPFYAASGIFAYTYRTWNKVRFPAIMTLLLGIINVLIVFLLCSLYKQSTSIINIVLTISMLFVILQSYVLNSYCFARIYKGNSKKLLLGFLKILIVLLIVSLFSYFISTIFSFSDVCIQLLAMGGTLTLFAIVIFCFILSNDQKVTICNLIVKK